MTNNKPLPKKEWTEQEKWVWEKLCAGEEADFNNPGDPEKEKLYGKDLDPKKDKLWNFENKNAKNRILFPGFLETILCEKLYTGALHRKGVRIIGAWFTDAIDLSFAILEHQLWLNISRFDAEVDFSDLKSHSLISFGGSKFNGVLNLHRLHIDGDLFMRGGAEFDEVDLASAKIGGQLSMIGSKFIGKLNMNSLVVKSNLFMREGAEFEEVDIKGTKIDGYLDMDGSKFIGKLDMGSVKVSQKLFMRKAEFNKVCLLNANISKTAEMDGSKFKGKLDMDSLEVNGNLFMRGGAEFNEVDIRGAKIGGTVSMIGSKFTGKLDMNSFVVKSSLFMRGGAEFNEVDLVSAKIGGQIDMSGSKFTGNLVIERTSVNETVFMRKAAFEKPVDFYFSKIGGDLDITDTPQEKKLPSFDLTATEIKGELYLGSNIHKPTQREEGAKLTLRNTTVGTIQDLENSWPDELELRGFTYSNLGGFAGEGKGMAARKVSKLIEWLEKQKEYSPQPYEQLAKVLKETGHKDKANEILYESKQKEREKAKGWRKLGMWILEATIGYGYYPLRSIISIIALTIIGALFLKCSGQGMKNGMPWGISYSFDMLLPIIELNKAHYSEAIKLTDIVKYYFYFHKLLGWILATVYIAGLSGITKK